MSAPKPPGDDLDRVLGGALPDDLGADVEAELRLAMRSAWHRAALEERPWGWPRPALAAAAVLMVVVAGVAAPGASRAATEAILVTQTASAVLRRLHDVTGMACVLETTDEQGRARRYAITWRSGGETEVRVEREGGTDVRRLVVPAERTSLAALQRAGAAPATSPAHDPTPAAVQAWLTPERLARSLAGAWSPVPGGAPGEASFRVYAARDAVPLRVTIDERTRLPVRIEALPPGAEPEGGAPGAAAARFHWQITAPSALWPARPTGAL
ncbi:MAG: hypothetical protein FIA95_09375 [Gemmatimonadetes bacterium]|nr:hypothetical protein [Gemmatimonadota bacterium]